MRNKNICFAYFGDGKFLGWYSDSFGSITKSSPKLYSNSENQIDVIRKNFLYKLENIKKSTIDNIIEKFEEDVKTVSMEKANGLGILAIANVALRGGGELLKGKNIELRIVECPIYDGPNPDFDKEDYEKYLDERKKAMDKTVILDIPAPSIERYDAVIKFNKEYPKYPVPNWIYADYSKVKKWASKEPTEFLDVIKSE